MGEGISRKLEAEIPLEQYEPRVVDSSISTGKYDVVNYNQGLLELSNARWERQRNRGWSDR